MAQLKHFLWVAEGASYRLAADRACRSQSAISRSVQELERRLGARLLQDSKRVTLSPVGSACVPVVRDLVEHFDRAAEAMRRIAASEFGMLSIGATSTCATRLLPGIVSAFRKQFPEIELRLVDDNSVRLRDMVKAGELDWALCSLYADDPKLEFVPLVSDAFGFVCSLSHRLAGSTTLAWRDILDEPLIRTTVHDHLQGSIAQSTLDRAKLFVTTMTSVWALLKAGEGVTVLPALSAPDPGSGLVYVPLREPLLSRSMGLLRLLDGNVTAASQAFGIAATDRFRRLAGQAGAEASTCTGRAHVTGP